MGNRAALLLLLVLLAVSCVPVPWLLKLRLEPLVSANPIGISPLPSITIRADGSVDPLTAAIQRVENVYTLTSNLTNYAITIECSNVTLN